MIKLSPVARILDLDGSVACQTRLVSSFEEADVVPLRSLGPSLRYLATRRSMAELENRLRPEDRHRLTLIGSGDFHHVTASLLRKFHEPLSLIVFDTHPDWDRTSPWPCCGSWVLEALRMPNVKKVVMIGLGRGDIRNWRINLGQVKALRSERAAFYPYDCPVSNTFGRVRASLPCAAMKPGLAHTDIHWNTVAGNDWGALIEEILASLPTREVYLSIDKDCLQREDAVTNWEPGGLTLPQLCRALEMISTEKEIIGADITGEYSPVEVRNPFFRALSRWDHPRLDRPVTEKELQRNETTNMELMAALGWRNRVGVTA